VPARRQASESPRRYEPFAAAPEYRGGCPRRGRAGGGLGSGKWEQGPGPDAVRCFASPPAPRASAAHVRGAAPRQAVECAGGWMDAPACLHLVRRRLRGCEPEGTDGWCWLRSTRRDSGNVVCPTAPSIPFRSDAKDG